MTDTFLHAITDLSSFFENAPVVALDDGELVDVPVPIFTGTASDALMVWPALQQKVTRVYWQKAAIAGSVPRQQGHRGRGPTPIQTLARALSIGPAYVSRMAKAHQTVVAALRDPGINRLVIALLTDDFFSFKHHLIATNHSARPFEALVQAKAAGLSANALERALAGWQPREVLDDGPRPIPPDDDDDDEPESVRALPTRVWRLPLTKSEYRVLVPQLRALGKAFGTADDTETIVRAVQLAVQSVERQKTAPSAA